MLLKSILMYIRLISINNCNNNIKSNNQLFWDLCFVSILFVIISNCKRVLTVLKPLKKAGKISNNMEILILMVKHEMLNYDFFVQHDNLTKYKIQL